MASKSKLKVVPSSGALNAGPFGEKAIFKHGLQLHKIEVYTAGGRQGHPRKCIEVILSEIPQDAVPRMIDLNDGFVTAQELILSSSKISPGGLWDHSKAPLVINVSLQRAVKMARFKRGHLDTDDGYGIEDQVWRWSVRNQSRNCDLSPPEPRPLARDAPNSLLEGQSGIKGWLCVKMEIGRNVPGCRHNPSNGRRNMVVARHRSGRFDEYQIVFGATGDVDVVTAPGRYVEHRASILGVMRRLDVFERRRVTEIIGYQVVDTPLLAR